MHVLHLINADAPPTTMAMLADVVAADRGAKHGVWLLGGSGVEGAAAVGLAVERRMQNPIWCRPDVGLKLRRAVTQSPYDVIHSWSLPMSCMRFTAPGKAVFCGPLPEPGAAVDAQRLVTGRRTELRMSWGVTDEQTRVVAALGEPGRVDALLSGLATGLAAETKRPVRLVISPMARGMDRALRVLSGASRNRLMIVDEAIDRPWEVLEGCDMALPSHAGVHAAWGAAAGLADVEAFAVERAVLQEQRAAAYALEHRAAGAAAEEEEPSGDMEGFVGRGSRAGDLARAICRLFDDPAKLAERGRLAAQAVTRFAPATLAAALRTAYAQAPRV
jgi:hypothetical protein